MPRHPDTCRGATFVEQVSSYFGKVRGGRLQRRRFLDDEASGSDDDISVPLSQASLQDESDSDDSMIDDSEQTADPAGARAAAEADLQEQDRLEEEALAAIEAHTRSRGRG